jgi:hypothetical protein
VNRSSRFDWRFAVLYNVSSDRMQAASDKQGGRIQTADKLDVACGKRTTPGSLVGQFIRHLIG